MKQDIKNGLQKPYRHVVKQYFVDLPKRTQDILTHRYDLEGKGKAHTLEMIGNRYGITRERIRQIIRQALNEIEKKNMSDIRPVVENIIFVVKDRGGIMETQVLLRELTLDDLSDHGAIRFFFEYAKDQLQLVKRHPKMRDVVALRDFSFTKFENIVENAKRVFEKVGKPMPIEDLYTHVRSLDRRLNKNDLNAFLSVSSEVNKNPFEHWGPVEWNDIVPRGTREKAKLILQYAEEPLHFREIASRIDGTGMGKRLPTNPQTVHNELIKDPSFVLVGRGTYALSDWGYPSGTVRDMINSVLEKAKRPVSKEEIFTEIAKVKKVKRTTVLINLSNYFSHTGKGTYTLK